MKIIADMIPKGRKNRPALTNKRLYITIHETANTKKGANAKAHANYVKNPTTVTSWHFTVDSSGTIYQHLPVTENAYHCGDGAGNGNRHSIGIELCVNSDGDFNKTMSYASELVYKLMKENNIPISNVVQHNKWSGKNCPTTLRKDKNLLWNKFIEMVKNHGTSEKVTNKQRLDYMRKHGADFGEVLWLGKMNRDKTLEGAFINLYEKLVSYQNRL